MSMTQIPIIPIQEKSELKTIQKLTVKRKKIIELPENPTYIMQSNVVTNMIFDGFSLIQYKVFSTIILALQDAIKANYNNQDYKQLSLFDKKDRRIEFIISLAKIAKHKSKYGEIKDAISKLTEISVKVPTKDENGKRYVIATNLIWALIPEVADYTSTVTMRIEENIADYLILFPRGKSGEGLQYTRYIYEVAINASSLYTIQLYWIIASWRKKGGFKMPYLELREKLGISAEKYPEFSDFKRRVLLPAQKDLTGKSDCWFNCNTDDFKTITKNPDGTKVTMLNFKVITPEFQETMLKQRENVVNMLTTHFFFKDEHLKELSTILEDESISSDLILMKVLDIDEAIQKSYRTNAPVKNKTNYAIKALINEDWKK